MFINDNGLILPFFGESCNTTASTLPVAFGGKHVFRNAIPKMSDVSDGLKAKGCNDDLPRVDLVVATQEAWDELKRHADHQFNQGAMGGMFTGLPVEIDNENPTGAARLNAIRGKGCLCLTMEDGKLQAAIHAPHENMTYVPAWAQYLSVRDW